MQCNGVALKATIIEQMARIASQNAHGDCDTVDVLFRGETLCAMFLRISAMQPSICNIVLF